jgi:3-hydroxyacyl-CoA dehydrogenase/enoyl-CoA hydratase/3-hydroxybutyryl-CoA epimerase
MSNAFRFEIIEGTKVGLLTFDTPDSKVNVLATPIMAELDKVLDEIATKTDLRGLIITSGKKDSFIVGANLEEIVVIQRDPIKTYNATQEGKRVFAKIENLPFPTLALINGTALGGGLELALACTYRLAVAGRKTKLGLPEVGLGFLPGWGGCNRLTWLVGPAGAMEFINKTPLSPWSASRCWSLGVVDEVIAEKEAMTRALEILGGKAPRRGSQPFKDRLLRWAFEKTSVGRNMFIKGAKASIKKPTRGGEIPAPGAVLKVITSALTQPKDKSYELESRLFSELAATQVSKNLVGLYFAMQASKKAPNNAKPNLKIGSIGVAGAGAMGAEIAYISLLAGFTVILYDKFQEGLDKGWQKIHDLLAEQHDKGRMSGDEMDNYLTSLAKTTDVAGFKNCDIVIEAIVENMKIKKGLLADIEKVKEGKPFIFATNTSSLSVTQMMADSLNPELHCGLHFFNPPSKMPLIEVIAGDKTPSETIASVIEYCQRLSGKFTVPSADRPLFIVNRVLIPYARETAMLLEEGAPAADVEEAMTRFGMRMGPLELMDVVGLDICAKVMHSAHEAYGDRLSPPRLLAYIEQQKLLGMKGKKGIYLWDENDKKTGINPEMAAVLGVKQKIKMERSAIQERLALIMIAEAARVIEEKVVDEPWQVDLAMIMGTGYPADRGGPLRYADTLGIGNVVQKLTWLSKVYGENYKPCDLLIRMAQNGETFYK